MSSNDPDQIRADIERTRAQLSGDVNALADQANPKNVVQDQMDNVKEQVSEKVTGLKEKVFGSEDDYRDNGLVGDARGTADQDDRMVARPLEGPQHHELHEMADVQALRRRVDPEVVGHRPLGQVGA